MSMPNCYVRGTYQVQQHLSQTSRHGADMAYRTIGFSHDSAILNYRTTKARECPYVFLFPFRL